MHSTINRVHDATKRKGGREGGRCKNGGAFEEGERGGKQIGSERQEDKREKYTAVIIRGYSVQVGLEHVRHIHSSEGKTKLSAMDISITGDHSK